MDFNLIHPEMREGEMFFTSCIDMEPSEHIMGITYFTEMKWKSKRRGEIAYDYKGNVLENTFPIFIQKEEYMSKMKENLEDIDWNKVSDETIIDIVDTLVLWDENVVNTLLKDKEV